MSSKETVLFGVKVTLYFLGCLGVLFTALPLLRFNSWWIRVWDFPRVQVLILCVLILVLIPFFLSPFKYYAIILISLLILSTVYQTYCILPYTPVYPTQVEQAVRKKSKQNIKILAANVLMGNKDYQALLDLISEINPDVILLAEPNELWLKEIESLKEKYPHTISEPLENKYGIAMYSRLELINPMIKYLVEDDIPSVHTDIKLESGKTIKFYGVHPRPPGPTEADETTERDAELILVGKEIEKQQKPTILAGDLNDVAWSRTTSLFQKISKMLDPRIGRGFYNSFHAEYFFLRMPLDHVFHTSDFRLVEMKRLRYVKSDHFPIYIHLSLEETAQQTQEEPTSNESDKEDANKIIDKAVEKDNELKEDNTETN